MSMEQMYLVGAIAVASLFLIVLTGVTLATRDK